MKDLNSITKEKLGRLLAKGSDDAIGAIRQLEEDANDQFDFIEPLGENMNGAFMSNGNVYYDCSVGKYELHDNAIAQLSTKFNIGSRFTRNLMESDEQWKRDLIAHNLNEFSHKSGRNRFLMRAVKHQIRGVLSDKYKILDSNHLAKVFLEGAIRNGAAFVGGHNSQLNMFIEVVKPQLIQIDTVNNGVVELIFGGRLKTSDFGCGKLTLSLLYMQAICGNGQIGETLLDERHIGERLPEGFSFKADTLNKHTEAMKLKMRDMVDEAFDDTRIANQIEAIQKASSIEVDAKKYTERLQKEGKILKSEMEETEVIMLNNKVEDGVQGASTLWKLTQAISAMAREKEPVRQRELMELTGQLTANASIR